MARKYFPFYFSFRETAQTMKPKTRAAFYEAIIEYASTGEVQKLPQSISGYWNLVKPMLDAAKSHYEAGEKGGRSSKKPSFGSSDSETTAKTNGLCKEKEKEKEKEKDSQAASARPAAFAPHKGAGGGRAGLGSSSNNQDPATEAARQKFLNSIKRPEWAAADAAPPGADKEG